MTYVLVKNNKWKDLVINEVVQQFPISYKVKKIKDIITPEKKSAIKALSATKDGQYPFFNCSENQSKYTNNFLVDGENIFITTGGDFLFTLYHNGKASYSTDVWCVKTINDNTLFINYYLKNNYHKNQTYFRGFKFKHLDKKGFNEMELAIPPINIQKKISLILHKQEQLITNIEKLIDKNELIFNELSHKLLSGEIRIKENGLLEKNDNNNWKEIEVNGKLTKIPKDWDVEILKSHIKVINGYAFPKNKMDNIKKENSIPIIKIGNIQNNTIVNYSGNSQNYYCGEIKDFFVPQYNDLIVGLSGANAGKTGIYCLKDKAALNQRNAIIRVISEKINQEFFNYFWFKDSLEVLREAIKDSAIPNISSDDIENIEVLILPIKEQHTISHLLTKQMDLINKQKKLLIKEQEKFEWLLENLLSGNYLVEEI